MNQLHNGFDLEEKVNSTLPYIQYKVKYVAIAQ